MLNSKETNVTSPTAGIRVSRASVGGKREALSRFTKPSGSKPAGGSREPPCKATANMPSCSGSQTAVWIWGGPSLTPDQNLAGRVPIVRRAGGRCCEHGELLVTLEGASLHGKLRTLSVWKELRLGRKIRAPSTRKVS